jgi:hypothetical protein
MKKIFYLLSISFLLLQACSSGGSNNNSSSNDDNTLLMRKWYENWGHCSNGNRDYYEFLAPNIFRHYVYPSSNDCNYILPEYGTWTRNGITIVLKYDQSLGITDAILTIDQLTATTFSFVATGAFDGHYVLTSY